MALDITQLDYGTVLTVSTAGRVPLIWWMYLDLKQQGIVYNISTGL